MKISEQLLCQNVQQNNFSRPAHHHDGNRSRLKQFAELAVNLSQMFFYGLLARGDVEGHHRRQWERPT